MRYAIRSLVILAALGSTLQASPFLVMGDSAGLFLTGTLGVRADDNVLLASKKTSDVVFELVPGLEMVYGQNALTKGTFYYKDDISRFSDNDKLNTSLSSAGFNANYDDQKLKMNFDTSFTQLAQNTVDTRSTAPVTGTKADFIRRDVFHIEVGSEDSITDKTAVGGSVVYENIDYKRTGFDSSKITSVPIKYYYYVEPKIALSGGFSFRDTQLASGGIGSKDYFYNVGARGEFTPKLTGSFSVGYTERKMDAGSNENTVGILSSFTYAVAEKTSLQFGVNNDFGVSGAGQSERNLTWSAGVQSNLAVDWSAGASLSYRDINYLGLGARTDHYFEGSLNVTYTYSTVVNFTAGYTYRNNSSAQSAAAFNNNVFALAANIRY
jgi:hypothetical protein